MKSYSSTKSLNWKSDRAFILRLLEFFTSNLENLANNEKKVLCYKFSKNNLQFLNVEFRDIVSFRYKKAKRKEYGWVRVKFTRPDNPVGFTIGIECKKPRGKRWFIDKTIGFDVISLSKTISNYGVRGILIRDFPHKYDVIYEEVDFNNTVDELIEKYLELFEKTKNSNIPTYKTVVK